MLGIHIVYAMYTSIIDKSYLLYTYAPMSKLLQLPVNIDLDTITRLREIAARRNVSVAHVVRTAVAAYLVDPDADLRRQLGIAALPQQQQPIPSPQPPPGTWRRPAADPLAPRA